MKKIRKKTMKLMYISVYVRTRDLTAVCAFMEPNSLSDTRSEQLRIYMHNHIVTLTVYELGDKAGCNFYVLKSENKARTNLEICFIF